MSRRKFIAKICSFSIANGVCARYCAVIGLAEGIIATVFTDMQINAAMRARCAKEDLAAFKRAMAFPAISHEESVDRFRQKRDFVENGLREVVFFDRFRQKRGFVEGGLSQSRRLGLRTDR